MNRKFGKESMKTPSVSTLIKRFDTGESNEPAGTTVTSPPRRVQTKAKSHHLQSAPHTLNKHISGAPPRSPSPFRKCTEPPQRYEPPIKPNESEHSYRESTTSDHVYIELCWWEIIYWMYTCILCWYTLSHWRIQDLLKGGSKGQGCGAEAFRFWSKTILNFSSYTWQIIKSMNINEYWFFCSSTSFYFIIIIFLYKFWSKRPGVWVWTLNP